MITYTKKIKKNPQTKEVKYYAQIAPVKPINLDEIADRAARCCTVTAHDIKAVLSAVQEQIIDSLRSGQSVRLGDIGSFRPTITATGCPAQSMVTTQTIKSIRVRFTPGTMMRQGLSLSNPLVRFGAENESGSDDEAA